ncbi:MAG: toll/interleukin-1 receptor domain-containing protein [Caulobacterales bacterium]
MASVVIIHAAENALPARALAEKLRAMRLTPMIELPPGDALRQAVDEAIAVIGLWSPQSASQDGILAEVRHAGEKLINARMQNTAAPSEFAAAPTIDLTGWRGEDSFPGWRALADQVAKMAGVAAPPLRVDQPLPPPGFFNPGSANAPPAPRPAPNPRVAPAPPPPRPRPAPPRLVEDDAPPEPKKAPNLAVIGIITFLIVAAVAVGGYFAYDQFQSSQASSVAWQELDKNDPAAIRAFIEAGAGSFQEEAETALDSLEVERLNEARARDTIQALERFLADFPDSRHSLEINGRIAELRSAAATAPQVDPATGLPLDPNAPPVETPPAGTPGETSPTAPPNEPPSGDGPVTLTPPPPDPTPAPTPAPAPVQ